MKSFQLLFLLVLHLAYLLVGQKLVLINGSDYVSMTAVPAFLLAVFDASYILHLYFYSHQMQLWQPCAFS